MACQFPKLGGPLGDFVVVDFDLILDMIFSNRRRSHVHKFFALIISVGCWRLQSLMHLRMMLQCLRLGAVEDFFGSVYLVRRTVGNQKKLVGLKRRLIL